jgi:hypothetical protein
LGEQPGGGVKFEVRVTPRVRDLVASLKSDDRSTFDHSLDTLCSNPYLDNVTKFAVPYPPEVLFLYQDDAFRIVYRIVDNVTVDLLNLSWAPLVPTVAEWDDWRNNN